MKISLRICMVVGSMLVLLVAGTTIQAQVVPQQPILGPGYGVPYGTPVMVNPYGQPVFVQGAAARGSGVPASTAQISRAENGETRPAYRVSMVGDETQNAQKAEQKSTIFDDFAAKDADCKAGDCDYKGCGHVGNCGCNPYAFRVYGEFLYLRARDSEVCYAVETNSNLAPPGQPFPSVPIQVSPIAVLDQDYSPGFRLGFGVGLDERSELGASYTWFDTSIDHSITRGNDMNQITPMVLHPATFDAITGTVEAAGYHDLRMDVIDIDYRGYLVQSCTSSLDYVIGARWGRLEQNFGARFTDDLSFASNAAEVATDIDFTGAGLKLGLEAERFYCAVPLKLYAKGMTSLMAGEFDATYQQTVQNNSGYGVNTGWKAGRIVPTFDLEIGGGFYMPQGRLQATIGYVFSAWANVVKTEDWIHSVQTNDFRDMGDTITFDGLVARVEGRF
jgi:hypothetical protein